MVTVVRLIHSALQLGAEIQTVSGPKLVDFKKACSIEIAKFDKCCERAKAAEAAEAAEAAAGAGAAGAAARAAAAGGR